MTDPNKSHVVIRVVHCLGLNTKWYGSDFVAPRQTYIIGQFHLSPPLHYRDIYMLSIKYDFYANDAHINALFAHLIALLQ